MRRTEYRIIHCDEFDYSTGILKFESFYNHKYEEGGSIPSCSTKFEISKIFSSIVYFYIKDSSEQMAKKKFIVTCKKCGKQFEVLEEEKTFPKKEKYIC